MANPSRPGCIETTVADPGLFDVLFGHGIPRLYFRKRKRQCLIAFFPVYFLEYLRRGALKWIVQCCRLCGAKCTVTNLR